MIIKILRYVLAVVLGLIVGCALNMGLILISGKVIPPPPGADVTTVEGLKEALPLFEPRHFLFPFLAHSLGTLVGAFVAGLLAPGKSAIPASVIGFVFLLGGIANVAMLPSPLWFSAVDLLLAYLPAAWVGQRLAARTRLGQSPAP
jgi:hypothetical protein